ncbi:hypothetical protein SAMN05216355_11456 [Actinomyces ruminicola]|uniref:Uncharacterized protein n=1 Tax=Actinomyces ruminicola TaxID=332524 RepID=A0A1H0E8H1_9ACTO|nr:hypothetical protein [Actinomyces ruminicola]SDN78608.1 hypothetical protein SAMN05216355_11456 [Actinomyces ruminicola]
MGIGTWALLALVAVLAVYLLPFLVGRREAMGMANAEDRYSSELRLLATGNAAVPEGGCGGGHAMIFRRRPEVRAMNRPEVRNVRALRKERELVRVRAAHERGRERRRVAASHRATVALILLGMTLGALVVAGVTVMPWWPVAIPAGLLCASAVAGRRAARASAASDLRERRRIAALERELTALTGGSAGRRLVEDAPQETAEAAQPQSGETAEGSRAGQDPRAQGVEAEAAEAIGQVAELAEPEQGSAADTVADRGATDDAGPQTPAGDERGAASAPAAEAAVPDAAASAPEESGGDDDAKAPKTPPQGWHPVSVPAPTYTLAARAPRRSYEPPVEEPFDSAPVPERPRGVRTYPTADVTVGGDEPVFHPIDLEAVLERRRAGA